MIVIGDFSEVVADGGVRGSSEIGYGESDARDIDGQICRFSVSFFDGASVGVESDDDIVLRSRSELSTIIESGVFDREFELVIDVSFCDYSFEENARIVDFFGTCTVEDSVLELVLVAGDFCSGNIEVESEFCGRFCGLNDGHVATNVDGF